MTGLSRTAKDFDLAERVALVVGSSRGIGRAVAEGFAASGAHVAVAARSAGELSALAAQISEEGGRAEPFPADVSDTSTLMPLVEEVVAVMGRIDIVVNAVGITRRAHAVDVTEEDWDAVLGVNLKSLFFLSQAVARYWIHSRDFSAEGATKGKIVHIASLASAIGLPLATAYAASKSGVLGVTRVLAIELARSGICVNAIAPGYIATEMTRPLLEDTKRSTDIVGRIPMGHWGTPQDLVGPAIFLASSASDYITGQVLYVDGGWTAG